MNHNSCPNKVNRPCESKMAQTKPIPFKGRGYTQWCKNPPNVWKIRDRSLLVNLLKLVSRPTSLLTKKSWKCRVKLVLYHENRATAFTNSRSQSQTALRWSNSNTLTSPTPWTNGSNNICTGEDRVERPFTWTTTDLAGTSTTELEANSRSPRGASHDARWEQSATRGWFSEGKRGGWMDG